MTIRELQEENAAWVAYNLPDSVDKPHRPLLGIVEEIGELAEVPGSSEPHAIELLKAVARIAHSRLKREQNIRIGQSHVEAAQDAIADIMIFLVHYCETEGWDCEEIVTRVWGEVCKRDWQKDRVNAGILGTVTAEDTGKVIKLDNIADVEGSKFNSNAGIQQVTNDGWNDQETTYGNQY